MYYQPGVTPHGLPYDPFKACLTPRPIGWISTVSPDGKDNLAPYSQTQNISFDPPMIMMSVNHDPTKVRAGQQQMKDTAFNAIETGEFVWNLATYDLRHQVNESAAAHAPDVDEFEAAGLTKLPSEVVKPKRVKESKIHFECKVIHHFKLPGNTVTSSVMVIVGQVVGIHINDTALTADGKIDTLKLRPLARCGYYDYTSITELFELKVREIEGSEIALAHGMEGSADKTAAHYVGTSVKDSLKE